MTRSPDRGPPPEWPIAADPDGRDAQHNRFRVLDDAVLNEARRRDDEDEFPLWPEIDTPPYLREAPPQQQDAEPPQAHPEPPEWASRAQRHRFLDDPSYRERFADEPRTGFDTSDSGWPILPGPPTGPTPQPIIEGTVVEEDATDPAPDPAPAPVAEIEAPAEAPAESPAEKKPRRRDAAFDGIGVLDGTGALRTSRLGPRVVPPRAGIPHTRQTRRPVHGLTALLLLAVVSAFFGWVTAEPFWLAVGHSERGTATVSRCVGDGLTRRCEGTFSVDGELSRVAVPILGDAPDPGRSVPARMTSTRGDRVYVGSGGGEQAAVGIALLMLCGFGIAWATGGMRLIGRRARTAAVAVSLTGPLLLFALMLGATY
jgi:hypothetical protein